MAGMFDDLIPAKQASVQPQPRKPGMFDDLVPVRSDIQHAQEPLSPDEFAKRYGQPTLPAGPESLSLDEFAKKYGQPQAAGFFDDLPDAKSAGQQQPQSAGMFDDLVPQQAAAPDPTAAIAAQRHPMVLPKGGAVISPQTQAQAVVSGRDLMRETAQDATFNYSDEAIAGVRAALGEDYAKALEDERAQLKAAEQRLGPGGRAAAEGLSFLMPMGPVARSIQRLAGPGAGLIKTAAASALPMAGVGGVSAVGALNDRSDIGADAKAALTGAGEAALTTGALHVVGVPAARAGRSIIEGAADLASRPLEWVRYHAGNPMPLTSTTNFAVNRLADAAELGGTNTPQDLQAALATRAVPDTQLAVVNAGNDRILAEALQSAADLKRPNLPRLVNGQRRDDNVFQALQDAQATNAQGQSQGDAFRERLFDNAAVPDYERDLASVRQHDQQRLSFAGQQLGDLDARPNGQPFRAGNVPGMVQAIVETPDLANAYRQAARDVGIAGARDSIAPEHIPLLPNDYNAELHAFQHGNRATAPVALTDSNVPMPILSQMRQQISALSASKDPIERARGARLMSLYDQVTNGVAPNSAVGQLTNINRTMHGIHNRQEDIAAGYRLPSQVGLTRADAIADARTPGPMQTAAQAVASQNDFGLGLTHGVADASKVNENNLGAVAENLFSNPDFRTAYDEFTQARNPAAIHAEAIAQELENIGNMQGVSSLLESASQNRKLDQSSLPAEALGHYIRSKTIPSIERARTIKSLLNGRTQARTAEIARLATDTTGEGARRLADELSQRGAARNASPPLGRTILVNEIARQLAGMSQQNQ